MILYTIYPHDVIFDEEEDQAKKKQKTLEMNGVKLIVEETEGDDYKILQLISSDPNHFLDQRYQPGEMVTMKPLL
ncbi:YlzJ-like protein [Scopulibacillus darangshiensis]|uniref:YlzJ-like protein n=1 Tax=Scopulibacillus darangshiensis TaxID=442528 RepID=A0A4V2SN91_9BACL|nr:YlzJ-like family protein [Scopulibacillus darangshiensis]TCP30276.1 YlzJ-like protein [Scopulibacillus darangshiensis]